MVLILLFMSFVCLFGCTSLKVTDTNYFMRYERQVNFSYYANIHFTLFFNIKAFSLSD